VVVTVTASILKGEGPALVKTFEIAVGALETRNLNDLETLNVGAIVYSEVKVLWKNPTTGSLKDKAFIVGDSTGYGYLVNDVTLPNLKVGDFIGISYEISSYFGYIQLTKAKFLTPKGTMPTTFPAATTWTGTEAINYLGLSKFGIRFITLNDLIGFASISGTSTFLNAYLPGFGANRSVRTDVAPLSLENMKFNATGFIIGRGSNFITFNSDATNYSAGVAATDAEKLAISSERFVAPAANNAVTGNLNLSTTVTYGTIAWTSDNPSVISNSGVVTRPAPGQPDVTVKLSYVITVGSVSSAPVEITFVVKAGEPIVTLYSADYGTTGKSGYGEGMIFQDNSANNTWANVLKYGNDGVTPNANWNPAIHSVNKNRVQIGTSTGIHTRGAFLVFGPISTALVAYLEFDLSSIVNPGKLGFSYAIWSSADGANFLDSTKVTSAVLSLEKFDGTNWVPLTPTLNLVANASATAYKSTSFDLTGAAKYRLVYTLAVPTGITSSQSQRLTIDDVIVTDK
jgi:hypothetical protein